MKQFAFIFLFAATFLIIGNESKPATNNAKHCRACNNFVTFTKTLTDNGNDEHTLMNALIKWCVQSGSGNQNMCYYLAKSVVPTTRKVISDGFCEKIEACGEAVITENNEKSSNSSISCEFCLNTFTHIKEILSSQQTENEIKLVLSKICEHLGSFSDECNKMLDQNLDDLFDFFRNALDPKKLCDAIGFCPGLDELTAEKKRKPDIAEIINIGPVQTLSIESNPLSFGPECLICKKVLVYIYDYIKNNHTEEAIKNALDKVCDEIFSGSRKDKCEEIVNRYYLDLVKVIELATEPEIACSLLGLCVEFKKVDPKPNCFLCKNIISFIYSKLKDNATEEMIKAELDKVCDYLPSADRPKCKQLVEQYTDEIIQLILQAETPEAACKSLGLCSAKVVQPLTKIELSATRVKAEKDSTNCLLCKNVISFLYSQLEDNATEEMIKAELAKVCDYLPSADRSECEKLVEQYTDEIIQLIMQDITPEIACQTLGICSTKAIKPLTKIELSATRVGRIPIIGAVVPVKGELCDICRQIFGFIYSRINNPKSRDEVIAALDIVCAIVPSNKQGECRAFIKENVENIIDLVAKVVNPEKACSFLRVCTYSKVGGQIKWKLVERNEADETDLSKIKLNQIDGEQDDNREPFNPTLTKSSSDEVICFTCQVAAHFIQEQLYNNDTETVINQFVEKHLCALISSYGLSTAGDKCNEFINTYGPQIEQLIAQKYFDPSTLCTKELRLCPQKKTDETFTQIQFELIKPNKQKTCQICVKSVEELDRILSELPIEKDLNQLAEKTCRLLPADQKDECQIIIKTFGRSLIQLIGHLKDAHKVCHAIDLCMIPGQVHLLGANKCTFGPTYWCHTAAHAEACKTTEYCRTNIWKPIVN